MIPKQTIELVKARAAGYCEACGLPGAESMALHHRKLKSRGGKDTAANLIWIHHSCHNLATDSIHLNPEKAEHKGFMVGSWADPEDTPIARPDGTFALLFDDGSYKILGGANER